jgi:hypothetical protein
VRSRVKILISTEIAVLTMLEMSLNLHRAITQHKGRKCIGNG